VNQSSPFAQIASVAYLLTQAAVSHIMRHMIRSIRHKGLRELHETGKSSKVRRDHHARALRCLDVLNQAKEIGDLAFPPFKGHALHGHTPARYSIWVTGAWRITFELEGGDAFNVDLEQYH
jgi:proteic killer suppression protein